MSIQILQFIPADPEQPPPASAEPALALLRAWAPAARRIDVDTYDSIIFFHPTEYGLDIACPRCGYDLNDWWWQTANSMHYDLESASQLIKLLPCCQIEWSMNDLAYHWPAGFARWALAVSDDSICYALLPADQHRQVEELAGCPLRQVITRL
jgi:hypothetical protein